MRNHVIDAAEGAIFAILLSIVVRLLGIEVTGMQMAILTGFSIFTVMTLHTIGTRFKVPDELSAIDKKFTYQYGESTIVLQYRGAVIELLVDGQVQDSIKVLMSAKQLTLTGKLPGGEVVEAKTVKGINKWEVSVSGAEVQAV